MFSPLRRFLAGTIAFALALVVVAARPEPASADPPGVFDYGVAAGEVTETTGTLWTRAETTEVVRVDVATDAGFGASIVFSDTATPAAGDDYNLHLPATGLSAGTDYHYRFAEDVGGGAVSQTGKFETLPDAAAPAPFKLTFTGDANTLEEEGVPVYPGFEVFNAMAAEDADLQVFLGDTIYSDAPAPISDLADYRDKYKAQRDPVERPSTQAMFAAAATLVHWDDHEIVNDWNPFTVDPVQLANGTQAFKEYNPVTRDPYAGCAVPDALDGSCVPTDPFYHSFRWGSDVEVIVLDERAYRSPQVIDDAAYPALCDKPVSGDNDLAPTAPKWVRGLFGIFLASLRGGPGPGCLAAIKDPARTLLGEPQKQWLLDSLSESDATFKIIINEVPIQEYWALPYDRWEGYANDRKQVINHIHNNKIRGVVWLTTDTHGNYINRPRLNTLQFKSLEEIFNPRLGGIEFVTGPVGTESFEDEVVDFVGDIGPLAVNIVFDLVRARCVRLDSNSYTVVEVDPGTDTMTVTPKFEDGSDLCPAPFTVTG